MLAGPELQKVHPLGKSPVITVEVEGQQPRVIAESGAIVEFLCDYYGTRNGHAMIPQRWKEGQEGKIGGETEEWSRWRYFAHYAEGSLMSILVMGLVIGLIKEGKGAPFFIKPITRAIGSRVEDAFLNRNYKRHFSFLEEQLKTSPGGGEFICGKQLTGADILMIYPLQAAKGRVGLTKELYPKIFEYVDKLEARDAYKKAVQKIVDETGDYNDSLV